VTPTVQPRPLGQLLLGEARLGILLYNDTGAVTSRDDNPFWDFLVGPALFGKQAAGSCCWIQKNEPLWV
jgi:hypothetical protein